MRRSPIEILIDRATGFEPGGSAPRVEYVRLYCPRCRKEKRARRLPCDPPANLGVEPTVELPCPDCWTAADADTPAFQRMGEHV